MSTTINAVNWIENDNSKKVAVDEGKVRLTYYKVTSSNVKPGMPVKLGGTATGGESGCVETANTDIEYNSNVYGIAELDKDQIASCAVAYTALDVIPVIKFAENRGVRVRNLIINNPAANVPANSKLTCKETGFTVMSTEPSISGSTGFYVATDRFKANPAAEYRGAGVIL
jgi:hypothetical protein